MRISDHRRASQKLDQFPDWQRNYQTDFGIFQTCFTTAGELLPLPGCHCFDRAGDELIDAEDLEEFMNCATGPGILWEQALTPLCIP